LEFFKNEELRKKMLVKTITATYEEIN